MSTTGTPAADDASAATGMSSLTGATGSGGSRSGGRSGGRSGRSGRSGRGSRHNNDRRGVPRTEVRFVGRIDELKGHIYDITDPSSSAAKFISTTEEIAEYIGRSTMKMSNHVKIAIETQEHKPIALPEKPIPDDKGMVDEVEQEIYDEEKKLVAKEKRLLLESMQKAHSILYGQCSDAFRARLQAMPDSADIALKADAIRLIKNIHSVMTGFQSTKYVPMAIHAAKKDLYAYTQGPEQSTADYYKKFKGKVDVIEHNGGTLADIGLVEHYMKEAKVDPANATNEQKLEAAAKARDAAIGCTFLMAAHKARFGKLNEDLENDYTQGIKDKYPKDLMDAYTLLSNWKQDPQVHPRSNNPRRNDRPRGGGSNAGRGSEAQETTFATVATTGNEHPAIRCYNCQQFGHYASDCTNERVERDNGDTSDVQLLMDGIEEDSDEDSAFSFLNNGVTKEKRGNLPSTWILLDNQSTAPFTSFATASS